MLEQLFDSRGKLALAIGLLSVINYFVARLALSEQSRVAGPGENAASARAQLAKPFIVTAIIVVFVLVADRFSREVLGGGWLVMQIMNLGPATADLIAMKAHTPDLAAGRVDYSVSYGLTAARSVGMAIIAAAVALLFSSWAFATGALLMLATGIGWYRRAIHK